VSIIGVYGGFSDKIPTGALMNKGLTIKTGQCHVHKYVPELLDHIRKGRIDPSFVVTQRMPLSRAPGGVPAVPVPPGRVRKDRTRPGGVRRRVTGRPIESRVHHD
jgi:threonine dehydrogenase-like Zn-dependent dehydrogenase